MSVRRGLTLQKEKINEPLGDRVQEKVDEPGQRVLVHGIDVGQVRDGEEEDAGVNSYGSVAQPRLFYLLLCLFRNLQSASHNKPAFMPGLYFLLSILLLPAFPIDKTSLRSKRLFGITFDKKDTFYKHVVNEANKLWDRNLSAIYLTEKTKKTMISIFCGINHDINYQSSNGRFLSLVEPPPAKSLRIKKRFL